MKKLILFLLTIVITSCNSLAGNTTQVSSSDAETPWKSYTNTEVGFSIQYPANWQEQDLPDENDGQRHHINLQGPEGGVELIWGTGFGGACPEGYQPVSVAKGTWPACHTQTEDGTDLWSLEAQPIGDTSFAGFVHTNDTTSQSRDVVLKVVSTLSFP